MKARASTLGDLENQYVVGLVTCDDTELYGYEKWPFKFSCMKTILSTKYIYSTLKAVNNISIYQV